MGRKRTVKRMQRGKENSVISEEKENKETGLWRWEGETERRREGFLGHAEDTFISATCD